MSFFPEEFKGTSKKMRSISAGEKNYEKEKKRKIKENQQRFAVWIMNEINRTKNDGVRGTPSVTNPKGFTACVKNVFINHLVRAYRKKLTCNKMHEVLESLQDHGFKISYNTSGLITIQEEDYKEYNKEHIEDLFNKDLSLMVEWD